MTLADLRALRTLRTNYQRASLSEEQVDRDPIKQLSIWLQQALDAKVAEPSAMSLATVGSKGRPSSRIVLIKELDQRGITWYTHYSSKKGQQLATNPYAALLFFWPELERQIRIEGSVEQISAAENDAYFNSRPLESRYGALASEQSNTISSRSELEQRFSEIKNKYGEHVPRPPHWGGYRLTPDYFEFWQGRPSRLHDRIAYAEDGQGGWVIQRLQP